MSELNVMTAILKFINGRNDNAESLRAVCDYTTDKAKTTDGTLVATYGCSLEHPVEDILANKRLHNKTHGKQYEHFVFAPCPNGSDKSSKTVLKVTKEIVTTIFPENMSIISVHTDSKWIHAHVILDALNAVTGRKFSQSPSDLNRIKQKANNILKKNGFELITASANEFVDHTDHSKEEGFNFLELDESQFITEATVEEISSFTDNIRNGNYVNTTGVWYRPNYPTSNFFGGYNTMNNYTLYAPQTQAMPVTTPTVANVSSNDSMPQQTQEFSTPVPTVESVPTTVETTVNSYPNTNVVTGPTFRIKGTPESNFAGFNELVEQTTAYAQEHQREAANLALAMQQYGQQNGYPSNVSVYAGPIFDIDLTGGMYPPMPSYDENKF
ncbi:MAG: relaxase/mobilization nuclease domain-containing protein [Ruminococcus sp.]|nr:relaxase/mobilization nuclease domain-containing protein [Ruminococcus sp.]